jgi:hypothetical protein
MTGHAQGGQLRTIRVSILAAGGGSSIFWSVVVIDRTSGRQKAGSLR